jgi:hypothetical protein
LLGNESGIAESAHCGGAGVFYCHTALPLLFFFQIKVRL